MTRITKPIDWLTTWVADWACWINGILMLFVCFEVFMRYVLNKPTIWGMDWQTMLSAVGRMIGIGYAEMLHSHATVDVITIRLSKKAQKVLMLIGYLFFFFPIIGALTQAQWNDMLWSWKAKERILSSWRPIVYPLKTVIVACYILLLLQGLAETIKCIQSLTGKETTGG